MTPPAHRAPRPEGNIQTQRRAEERIIGAAGIEHNDQRSATTCRREAANCSAASTVGHDANKSNVVWRQRAARTSRSKGTRAECTAERRRWQTVANKSLLTAATAETSTGEAGVPAAAATANAAGKNGDRRRRALCDGRSAARRHTRGGSPMGHRMGLPHVQCPDTAVAAAAADQQSQEDEPAPK